MNPFKIDLALNEFERPNSRFLKEILTVFIMGKPRPKARLRHFIAGKWAKWKPSESLLKLKSFLTLLKSFFIEPELPAEDLQSRIRERLDILSALESLPEGRPKVIGTTPTSTVDYEGLVAEKSKKLYQGEPSKERIAIFFRFIFNNKTWADTDNLEKSVIDGLVKGGVIHNDRQVEVHLTFRDYCKDKNVQGVVVKIYEVFDT